MSIIVIKIGGSTLGSNDTTAEDLIYLQNKGHQVVVVHGGGKAINQWLDRCQIKTEFHKGLRVTDIDTLKVATAVLSGLVNKEIVSDICVRGGKAIGICGVDGQMMQGENIRKELGYVGEKIKVDTGLLKLIIKQGYMPVIAPIGIKTNANRNDSSYLLNINGDVAAAEIAHALEAEKLIYLTDVTGLYNESMKLIKETNVKTAKTMIESGVISSGMIVKVEACIHALEKVNLTRIIDGRKPHALLNEIEGKGEGTTIVR